MIDMRAVCIVMCACRLLSADTADKGKQERSKDALQPPRIPGRNPATSSCCSLSFMLSFGPPFMISISLNATYMILIANCDGWARPTAR